jgi:hypothetical protein
MRTTLFTARPRALLTLASLILLGTGCKESDSGRPPQEGTSTIPSRADSSPPRTDSMDWKLVDQEMGRPGKEETGGVHRYSMPRSDLTVICQGVRIKPALSLGSWLAFKSTSGNTAVAMGDLVLTEQEYNRVITRLSQGGVTPTAVHKHLPAHSPALWWTHVEAKGNPVNIAETVHAALGLTGTPAARPAPHQPQPLGIDTGAISHALGYEGKVNGGVYQVSIPRSETIRASGIDVPGPMGTATVLNFQPTGGGKAAINGDFVMKADEVEDVVRALESSGIHVVALHNHMRDEEPRLFFLHFWANDDAVKLTRGLGAALGKMNVKKPAT